VYDAETTPPSVAKLQGLGPLLKAIELVPKLKDEAKKGPGYKRAEKEVMYDGFFFFFFASFSFSVIFRTDLLTL
jgi:hypothetical protein